MNKLSTIVSVLLVSLALVQCDFPSDPPTFRVIEVPVTPVDEPPEFLLPLSRYYQYAYRVEPKFDNTGQLYIDTARMVHAPDGGYYQLLYIYLDLTGEYPKITPVGLPLVKNTVDGLEFYGTDPGPAYNDTIQANNPILVWKFPYPADSGAVWINSNNAWKVELVSTDSLVYSPDNVQGYKSWVYNIYLLQKGGQQVLWMTYSIIPGKAIFRIDGYRDDLVVTTYAWKYDEE